MCTPVTLHSCSWPRCTWLMGSPWTEQHERGWVHPETTPDPRASAHSLMVVGSSHIQAPVNFERGPGANLRCSPWAKPTYEEQGVTAAAELPSDFRHDRRELRIGGPTAFERAKGGAHGLACPRWSRRADRANGPTEVRLTAHVHRGQAIQALAATGSALISPSLVARTTPSARSDPTTAAGSSHSPSSIRTRSSGTTVDDGSLASMA